jgi:flagellar hook protein FlgE
MSISASMNAGVLGLAANSTRLSTIADNLANAGTVGYKRADVQFSNMVASQAAIASTGPAASCPACATRSPSRA